MDEAESETQEITNPTPYDIAIDHICVSMDLDFGDEQDRQKAHFYLQRAVHSDSVLCLIGDERFRGPFCLIRTFRGGPGITDLAWLGGRLNNTIYEAADLEQSFPIPKGRKKDVESITPTLSNEDEMEAPRVRQPNKVWELAALEFGIYLGRGGDPVNAHTFVKDLVESRGLLHASDSAIALTHS